MVEPELAIKAVHLDGTRPGVAHRHLCERVQAHHAHGVFKLDEGFYKKQAELQRLREKGVLQIFNINFLLINLTILYIQ